MKNLKICAAVAGVLMSTGAFALDAATTAGLAANRTLRVAGASAARDTFLAEFNQLCQASTLNLFRAFPTPNSDFRAYSCQLLNASPVPVALRNQNFVVYYRSEGGSVWGPGSVAKDQDITGLQVTATNCTGASGTGTLVAPGASLNQFNDCTATYGGLVVDSGTDHLATRFQTDLGVSDEEPNIYRGENWANGFAMGSEPTSYPPSQSGFGQAFGVLVSTNVPLTSISKQDVASIYSGAYSDWSQVQEQSTGVALPAAPIKVCRREPGSGTQASAAVFFLNQSCGTSFEPFVTAPAGPNGNPVEEQSTTTGLEGCVGAAAGNAIGPNIFKSGTGVPAGTKYVQIDGVPGGKVNAARGTYGYAFESAFTKHPDLGLATAPFPDKNAMATLLAARARAVAGIPAGSASAYALPGGGNSAILPVAITGVPVALANKNANSCRVATGLN